MSKIYSKEEKEELYKKGEAMFNNGISLSKIGDELRIGGGQFSKYLKSKGYVIEQNKTKYTYNKDFFKVIDSEEKAYWLGFIYADGCIEEKKKSNGKVSAMELTISLAEVDRGHLEKFLKSIESNSPIRSKKATCNGKVFPACRCAVCCTELCRDLIKLGVVPNKSLILKFPTEEQVPKYLLKHFIRGYVDGDGTVRISKRNQPCLSMCGTLEFLEGVRQATNWENKIGIDKRNGLHRLELGCSKAKKQLDFLYSEANIYLDRKYEKYLEICRLKR